jgi:hypothetical protein
MEKQDSRAHPTLVRAKNHRESFPSFDNETPRYGAILAQYWTLGDHAEVRITFMSHTYGESPSGSAGLFRDPHILVMRDSRIIERYDCGNLTNEAIELIQELIEEQEKRKCAVEEIVAELNGVFAHSRDDPETSDSEFERLIDNC